MMLSWLAVEVERDDDGFHAVVIEIGTDCVLHVSNSFDSRAEAEAAARDWINRNE
jgi:hypothetical protein